MRAADLDHLDFIKTLLARGANVNARAKDSTETRTIFTMQWLYEDGATPFLRAAQSGRRRAHEAAARTRGGSQDRDGEQRHRACRGRGDRLGGGRDLRAIRTRQRRGREVVPGARHRPECGGRRWTHGAARRGSQGPQRGRASCSSSTAHDWTRATSEAATPSPASSWDGAGCRFTTPTASCASACSRRSRIPTPRHCCESMMTERGLPVPAPLSSSVCITAICK